MENAWHSLVNGNIRRVYHDDNRVTREQQIEKNFLDRWLAEIVFWNWPQIYDIKPAFDALMIVSAKWTTNVDQSLGNLTLSLAHFSLSLFLSAAHSIDRFAFLSLSFTPFHPLFGEQDVWFQFFRVTELKKGISILSLVSCQHAWCWKANEE